MINHSLKEFAGADWLTRHVREALAEDLGERGDITCIATVQKGQQGYAELVAKAEGIICGTEWAIETGHQTDPPVDWIFSVEDGDRVQSGESVATIEGSLLGILISERTALNGLGRLSGIATLTAEYVARVAGTRARILDTRKTTPGWRLAEKYAVRTGGGDNHRIGLYDEILIKENHIAASGGARVALKNAQRWREENRTGNVFPIEIEVENLRQLQEVLPLHPDRVLLDNFSMEDLVRAVELAGEQTILEASGGVTLETVTEVASSGVHRISSGALTHSFRPLDLSLRVRNT